MFKEAGDQNGSLNIKLLRYVLSNIQMPETKHKLLNSFKAEKMQSQNTFNWKGIM